MITDLQPDKNYYFRPVSDNPSVNPETGKELALIISQQPPIITGTVVPPAIIDCNYLLEYLRIDLPNNPVEVVKLQRFLKQNEGFADLQVNGVFDQATLDAVNIFQMRYFVDVLIPWGYDYNDPTGYVYITTKKKVNEIYCQKPFPLTSGQKDEITDMRNYLEALPQGTTPWPATTTAPLIGQTESQDNFVVINPDNLITGNISETEASSVVAATVTEPGSGLANIGGVNSAGVISQTETDLLTATSIPKQTSSFVGFIGRIANASNALLLVVSLIVFLMILSFVYVIWIIKRKRTQPEPFTPAGSVSPLPMNFAVVDNLPTGLDK
ncbi:MAG: peptidoglycan-binding domain-containing protein, partial [Candidatus Desantisbacteria bacterium]